MCSSDLSQGFLLNVGSFRSVIDTYQEMANQAKNHAREDLHATFFMLRRDTDIPQDIAGRNPQDHD